MAKELEANDPTYGSYVNVQKNARPLYRYHKFAGSGLDGWNGKTANAATNFIIECTWNPGRCDRKRKDGLQRQRDRHGLSNCSRHEWQLITRREGRQMRKDKKEQNEIARPVGKRLCAGDDSKAEPCCVESAAPASKMRKRLWAVAVLLCAVAIAAGTHLTYTAFLAGDFLKSVAVSGTSQARCLPRTCVTGYTNGDAE